MTEVEVRGLCVMRGAFTLKSISLTVAPGEIFVILGKTGSGKTMLLEAIAGFYEGYNGTILLNGVDAMQMAPQQRQIGVVYQDYGLFSHMTVFENIAYGLKMRHISRALIRERVTQIAQTFGIAHLMRRMCGALSGGERQRTALARALVLQPGLLLLDEPFAALDPLTREKLQAELINIHADYGCTILMVTHSFDEARLLGARIGIMINGELKAVRSADELYTPYAQAEVNAFLGINTENENRRMIIQ